jgi:hypothetical protein
MLLDSLLKALLPVHVRLCSLAAVQVTALRSTPTSISGRFAAALLFPFSATGIAAIVARIIVVLTEFFSIYLLFSAL